jgi:hypothetical protein
MLNVTIEKLSPQGRHEKLAELHIVNDGTGDDLIGHYRVTHFSYRPDDPIMPFAPTDSKHARVDSFPRNSGPLNLVAAALRAIGYEGEGVIIRELKASSRELRDTS